MTPASILVGLLPVLLFLTALILMDSYKLVTIQAVLRAIALGAAAAFAALYVNQLLLQTGVSDVHLKRYVAPLVEETLKAAFIVYLIRAARVGFMVDAGIHGFAVGAGFALVENAYYSHALEISGIAVWIVRGFGTAVLHGSCTAMFAIVSKSLADRAESASFRWFVPGLLLAAGVHSLFNQFLLNPFLETVLILVLMPLAVAIVFERSEGATRRWLGTGFDTDVELLELILSGEIRESRVGRYLESLKARFPGRVVGDMLCYLRIHLELSLRAKGILIARASGLRVPIDEQVRANFAELRFLERSVGRTGKMAILPILRTSSRDLWQIHMLGK